MNNIFTDDFKKKFENAYKEVDNQYRKFISYYIFARIFWGKSRNEIERDFIDAYKKYKKDNPDSMIYFIFEDKKTEE